jgi:SNF2 family DNA or RNA helicase
MKYKFRTQPYSWQTKAFNKAVGMDACALFIAPGGGKTKIAVDLTGYWYVNSGLKKVLVITPKSVIGVWEEEIDLHLGYGVDEYEVVRLTKKKEKKIESIRQYRVVDCLTYLLVTPDSAMVLFEEFKRWKPDVVIMDESHYIKNHSSKRSRRIKRIGRVAHKRLALTGTPMPKNYLDLWSQLDYLEEGFLGLWSAFKSRVPIWGGYMNHNIVGWDSKAVKWLKGKVKEIAVNVGKHRFNLPPIVYQKVPFYLEGSAKYYNDMATSFVAELDEYGTQVTAEMVITQMTRLQQITGGFVTDDEGEVRSVGTEKLDILSELFDKYVLDGKQKVVVFARFVPEVNAICELCKKKKIKFGYITGKVSSSKRDEYRNNFQNGDLQVMVCQIASGGIGITLNAARIGIFYSMDQQLDHYEQSRDRLDRGSITGSTHILFLVAKGSIDEEVMRRNVEKLGFSNILLGWRDMLGKVVEDE